MRLSLKRTAEIMVQSLALDPESLPFVHARLKNFNAKLGILRTEEAADYHRTRTLDSVAAAEAVLFSELADMGFDAQILREVREYLDRNPSKMKMLDNPANFKETDRPVFMMKLYRREVPGAMRRYSVAMFEEPASRASRTLDIQEIHEKGLATVLTIDLEMLLGEFRSQFSYAALREGR